MGLALVTKRMALVTMILAQVTKRVAQVTMILAQVRKNGGNLHRSKKRSG